MSRRAASTANYSLKSFDLHYFADSLVTQSRYRLYTDDGETPDAYARGKYEQMNFSASDSDTKLSIELQLTKSIHSFSKTGKDVHLVVHNLHKKPASIRINGSEISSSKWLWNNVKQLLHMDTSSPTRKIAIEIIKQAE
jgi:hypothetical protein